MRALVIGVAGLAVSSALANDPKTLAGDNLRQMVIGKTVVLNTPMGGIPISFRDNGTMTGRAHGMTSYSLRNTDSGRWWVSSDQLCQKWDSWLQGRAHCITVRMDGRTVHWRSTDGRTGTATIASN